MEVVHEFPPNVEAIRKVFPLRGYELFAYGDKIYHPQGTKLPRSIIAHEEVHQVQQGNDVESWWDRYLTDIDFRLTMELAAHRVEYRVMLEDARTRNVRRICLAHVARKLSAPLYGRMITLEKAKRALKAC